MNGEDVKDEGELVKELNRLLDELTKHNFMNALDELKSKVMKLGDHGANTPPSDKEVDKNVGKAAENKAALFKT